MKRKKQWKRFLALLLTLAMAISLCVPGSFALDGEATTSASGETYTDADAESAEAIPKVAESEAASSDDKVTAETEDPASAETVSDDAGDDADAEAPDDPAASEESTSDASPEESEASESETLTLNYVVVVKPELSADEIQQIVVGIGSDDQVLDAAQLTVREESTGDLQTYDATALTGGAVEFDIVCSSASPGTYTLVSLWYTYEGTEAELDFAECGVDARYGVCTEVETDPDDVIALSEESDAEVSLQVSAVTEDGELEQVDSIEEALTVSEVQQTGDDAEVTDGDTDVVVVLDPGHDATHGGAQSGDYYEEELTLEIAEYCQEELEQYEGVTVYMTRTGNECPFPDAVDSSGNTGTSSACNQARVDYAVSVGADYYVAIHVNAGGGTGAEIYYPNENYATSDTNDAVEEGADLNEEGEELSDSIMEQLAELGISEHNGGAKSTDSETQTYADGSEADDYLVIRESKKAGICGIIVEHCYLDSDDADAYLSSDEKLQALGVADATGIANYLELSKTGEDATDTTDTTDTVDAADTTDTVDSADSTDSSTQTVYLEYGATGSYVESLQNRLKELGYFTAGVDATFGAKTEAALIMFQSANGMDVDATTYGAVDDWTLSALESSSAVAFSALESGSKGTAVYRLQKYLIDLGYLGISAPDSGFGELTKAAVEDFQADNDLEMTGVADQATLALLYNRNTEPFSAKSLTYGDSGDYVQLLQERLKELGYFNAGIDAKFGAKTEAAVIMFQAANGMNVNSSTFGSVGGWTISMLESSSAVSFTALESGSSGTAVYRLQKYLIALNYLNISAPDSGFGSLTKAAVESFQSDSGLTVTGVADQATLALLYNRNTQAHVTTVTAVTYGDSGDGVKALQLRLRELGYFKAGVDATFGAKTEAALIMFQAANGMDGDSAAFGTMDSWTVEALNSSSAVKCTTYESGSTGTAVYLLQKYLIQLYYLNISAPDSSFGKLTKAAIQELQSDNGLTETGVADQATLAVLYNRNTKAHVTTVSVSDTLVYGSTGDEVTLVQRRLRELGYLAVLPDGGYGAKTEAAVIMFQAANEMYVYSSTFGTVGSWTEGVMNSDSVVACTTYQSGSSGTAVYRIQKYLIDLDYLDISEPDSSFGKLTKAALEEFQSDNGLTVNGIADQATLAVLYNRNTSARVSDDDSDDDDTDDDDTGDDTDDTPSNVTGTISEELSYGDTGDEVTLLEARLIELGYLTGTAGDTYDGETQAAVVAFQGANGISYSTKRIERYGSVDENTLDALNDSAAVSFFKLSTDTEESNAVKVLEIYLRDMGYLTDTPDGTFDEDTEDALLLFQETNGLTQSGVGNLAALSALYNPDEYNTLYLREKDAVAENAETVWNYLRDAGLSEAGTAGLMGNLFAESGLEPNNLQGSYNSSLGMTDEEYTAAVSDGTYTNFVNDGAGYGLAQWTYYSLKQDLYDYYLEWKETDPSATIGDLDLQLSFLVQELQSDYSSLWNMLETASDVLTASTAMLTRFERPADQGYYVQITRAGYGLYYLNRFGDDE